MKSSPGRILRSSSSRLIFWAFALWWDKVSMPSSSSFLFADPTCSPGGSHLTSGAGYGAESLGLLSGSGSNVDLTNEGRSGSLSELVLNPDWLGGAGFGTCLPYNYLAACKETCCYCRLTLIDVLRIMLLDFRHFNAHEDVIY